MFFILLQGELQNSKNFVVVTTCIYNQEKIRDFAEVIKQELEKRREKELIVNVYVCFVNRDRLSYNYFKK